MKIRSFCLLALLSVSPGLADAAHAQATPAALRPADAGWIARVQDVLNATHAIKARFQQIAPDGARSTGQALLNRPGRMRFDYDKPSPLLLVANQGQIVYQDRELGQVTTLPLDRTPLGLLLRPDLKLSGDVTVTGFEHDHGLVQVTVVRSATPGEGSLTLLFNEAPLSLRSWVVKDSQGRETQIDLFNIETNPRLPDSLFALPKEQD
ncbi:MULTISPECIES: outer membrane lipoprotein carrier protein LolA [unclassified Asaia]|uniref:LolA family protein n=1 Tax=unclassified Asaia TaxID=2685023 RepID=UPI0018F3E42E|nr:outer membrane lipoprotein carrier protein LolA [Asaia sp. W19]